MIIFKFFICFFSGLFAFSKAGVIHLNTSPQIDLSYSFPKNDTIRFTLESNTQGYVGIGFGTQMSGTNILIGYNLNGQFVVKDTTAYGHSAPVDHAIQNVASISASRNSSKTIFIFERILKTNDSNDYTIVPFTSTPLIWACGSSDSLVFHVNYGSTHAVFQQCDSSCLTCSGSSASECVSCDSGKSLVNNQCIIACDSSCLTCSGNSSTNCTSCDSNHQLINNTCIAHNCNSSCLNCSGPSDQNCTSCANGKYLSNNQCLSCYSSCLTCSGESYSECTSCPSNSYLNNDSSCVLNFSQCPLDNESSCFSVQLNSNPLIYLNWSFPSEDSIKIAMEFYTQGYIALGFGLNMLMADVVLANLTNGEIFLSDRTALGHFLPKLHAIQDSVLLSGNRTSEKTIIAFQRKLNTSSVNKTVIVPLKTNPLIWAYGSSDTLTYHGKTKRGMSFVSFIQCYATCKTCSGPDPNQCESCANQSHTLTNGSCCPVNCLTCSNDECLSCTANFSLTNGQCSSTETKKVSSIKLNDNPLIYLNYSFPQEDTIEMIMEFHTLGYISIGFGTKMSDSDMIVFYLLNDIFILKSMTASGHVVPTENLEQSLTLISSFRDTEKTVVTFQRKLSYQRILASTSLYAIIPNNNTSIIWAYGSNDSLIKHVQEGIKIVQFQLIACDSSCLTCTDSNSSQCTSCPSTYQLNNGSCIKSSCDSTCLTCSGPSNNQCLSCQGNYTLEDGMCILSSGILDDMTSELKVSDQFYIYWKFNSNNTITMALRWNTGGFLGLGFGKSMKKMDIITAEYSNSEISIYDRWSDSESTPSLDSDLGGTNDLTLLGFLSSDSQGYAVAKFIRALNTGDQFDYVIQQKNETFCLAFSDEKTLSYHGSNLKFFFFFLSAFSL